MNNDDQDAATQNDQRPDALGGRIGPLPGDGDALGAGGHSPADARRKPRRERPDTHCDHCGRLMSPAEMAGDDTVVTLASSGQHGSDGPSATLSASADTPAIRLVLVDVSRPCEHCGAAFVARRPWARFCSAYCRRVAWLGRNPERAAELAERDKARLRAHIIGNDGEWVD